MYQYRAIRWTNCCFGVKKIKLLLGWTSGFCCCKAKGLKRSKTATSKFFRTLKFFEIGIKNWTFANFGPNFDHFLQKIGPNLLIFCLLFSIFVFFIFEKKKLNAKNVNFGPLALQQKRPEVHPSNNFNFVSPKQQFVMVMARY